MDINERNWNILLDAIEKERVVPIIGDEFYYFKDETSGQDISVQDYLIRELANKFNVATENADFTSIADAIEVENIKSRNAGIRTDLYFEIDNLLRTARIRCRSNIEDFLSIGKFPLILTTSFVAGLESALTATYGDLKIGIYDKTNRNDLSDKLSATTPTLYYLFGKSSRLNRSYMVTDDDFLDYLHTWHNIETRPKIISKYLNGKFLLLLGCDYPDWLFRFFWHSIKNFSFAPSTYGLQGVVTRQSNTDDAELVRFLSRIQTGIFENSNAFIDEFMGKWEKRIETENGGADDESSNNQNDNDIDIFISYADEDREQAIEIATKLTALGANVWFDKTALTSSDRYDDIIEEKISKAKRFMPIISKTTMILARRYYRKEWTLAIKEDDYRYGMPYFAPVVIDDSDINSEQIPKPFREAHSIKTDAEDFETQLKKLIRSIRS